MCAYIVLSPLFLQVVYFQIFDYVETNMPEKPREVFTFMLIFWLELERVFRLNKTNISFIIGIHIMKIGLSLLLWLFHMQWAKLAFAY